MEALLARLAGRIQLWYRVRRLGVAGREFRRTLQASATRIQAVAAGHLARRHVATLRRLCKCIRIQATFRGHRGREEYRAQRRRFRDLQREEERRRYAAWLEMEKEIAILKQSSRGQLEVFADGGGGAGGSSRPSQVVPHYMKELAANQARVLRPTISNAVLHAAEPADVGRGRVGTSRFPEARGDELGWTGREPLLDPLGSSDATVACLAIRDNERRQNALQGYANRTWPRNFDHRNTSAKRTGGACKEGGGERSGRSNVSALPPPRSSLGASMAMPQRSKSSMSQSDLLNESSGGHDQQATHSSWVDSGWETPAARQLQVAWAAPSAKPSTVSCILEVVSHCGSHGHERYGSLPGASRMAPLAELIAPERAHMGRVARVEARLGRESARSGNATAAAEAAAEAYSQQLARGQGVRKRWRLDERKAVLQLPPRAATVAGFAHTRIEDSASSSAELSRHLGGSPAPIAAVLAEFSRRRAADKPPDTFC